MRKPKDLGFRVTVIVLTFLISAANNDSYSAFYMTPDYPLYGLVFVTLFWEFNRYGILRAYKRLLPHASMGKRILVVFCISYAINFVLRLLYFYGKVWLFGETFYPIDTYIWNNVLN